MSFSPYAIYRLQFDVAVYEDVGTALTPLKARVSLGRMVTLGTGWFSYTYEMPVPCLELQDGFFIGSW